MKLNFEKISLNFHQILWILPFITFVSGYICLQFFIADTIVQTPALIGKDILQATKICSELKLNLRIVAEKEVADAQPGTIIKQNPLSNSSIKTHQSIFITITKQPAPITAPNLIGKAQEQIEKICKEKGIKNRIYFLPSNYPAGQCFAQMPAAQEKIQEKKMTSYISIHSYPHYLFPDFTGNELHNVIHFLQQQNITYDVYYNDQKIIAPYKTNLIINYQKPLAGTLITPDNKLYVQLQVA